MKKVGIVIATIWAIGGLVFLLFGFTTVQYDTVNQGKVIIDLVDVEIEGEIVFPGAYKITSGTTILQLVNFAGGLTNKANLENINLQTQIVSSRKITIDGYDRESIVVPDILKVNINKATFQELIKVDGITETRAASIIVYREQYGFFNSIDEVINVKNIGTATFTKIKDFISI